VSNQHMRNSGWHTRSRASARRNGGRRKGRRGRWCCCCRCIHVSVCEIQQRVDEANVRAKLPQWHKVLTVTAAVATRA
jgi:hypothetical protein